MEDKFMIHDEICTYEVAKLAKEKGFPQKFNYSKFTPRYNYYNHKGELNGDVGDILKLRLKHKPIPEEMNPITAPTQSVLQRWLRIKHGVVVDVFVDDDSETPLTYNIYKYKNSVLECVCDHHGNYYAVKDWELCLEDALKYALENFI